MNHFTYPNLQVSRAGKGFLVLALLLCGLSTFAQVTTSTITGLVTDSNGEGLVGATVVATHVPSGTRYGTATNALGRYTLPAVRVGGPFSISVLYTGFEEEMREGIYTSLGTAANVDFQMRESGTALGEVTITASRSDIFSSDRTGAASTFNKTQLTSLPAIGSRSINSITKYNPNGNGSSFGAQDSRLNNFTIDGSVFNNGFGLGSESQAGGRTGSTAISLDAIEELQVNVAPFDVRQTGFAGSGINAITRSGTNEFAGSAYATIRKNDTTGVFNRTEFKDLNNDGKNDKITIGQFNEKVYGLRFGGPIIKNKLFFFVSGEMVRRTEPATTWVANNSPLDKNGSNTTRVEYQDLLDLSDFLAAKYDYETGPSENYDNETTSDKFLARLDFNINDRNKLTLRYTHHNSEADQLISNSSSLGRGTRRTNANSMSYQNSGYIILDNTRSAVLELNSTLSDNLHNTFLVGYDKQNENRKYKGAFFPTVDILKDNSTYISFGFDPFTPDNQLNYGTFHATNNVSLYRERHTFTLGANYEHYKSNNLFFPGNNGVYIFNSLDDFYEAAADTSTVTINRFQFRYSALPEFAKPLQVLKIHKIDFYGQDEFQVSNRFKLTYGIRAGLIKFEDTGLENPTITDQDFVDENGNTGYKINTGKLPDAKVLWEPRIGLNWDVTGKKKTQVRGGTGIFTGRPPYVWVSNQIGNNGVLTGFIDVSNTTQYKFTDKVAQAYTPDSPTLPSTFDIAGTDPGYKFPQVWKNNLAIDQKLPLGFVATAEFLYNRNINAVRYFDANLEPSTTRLNGPDDRPRFPGSGLTGANLSNAVRINDNVSRAAVMTTTNEGYYWGATFKLEYPTNKGIYGMFAYTASKAKDLMSAGSIASGSWTSVKTVEGNNILPLGYADQDLPDRLVGILGYRLEYGGTFGGATQISLGYVGETRGFNASAGITTSRFSYSVAGDLNGDGVSDNDLLFVPTEAQLGQVLFDDIKDAQNNVLFTADQQRAAFNDFIKQDDYLSTRRGQYAERNGVLFPMLHRFDLSVVQEFFIKIGKKRNTIQLRADILNVANLLDSEAGLGNNYVNDRPLSYRGVTADGQPRYQLARQTKNGQSVLIQDSFVKSRTQFDVWAAQFGIRYIFE